MNYEPNLGVYDMRRDTEGLPKSLAKLINKNICMKGGGGGSTSTTGVPEEWKPQVTKGLNISLKQLEDQMAGTKDMTAKLNEQQKDSLAFQEAGARDQIAGTGIYDMKKANQGALEDTMGGIMGKSSAGGALGSARSQKAMANALKSQSIQQQRDRQKDVEGGTKSLGDAGSTFQKQSQSELDETSVALNDYFKRLTGAAGTEKTTTGGGGK